MKIADKNILLHLVQRYSLKEVIIELAEICLLQASEVSDLELPHAAKEWSGNASQLQFLIGRLK